MARTRQHLRWRPVAAALLATLCAVLVPSAGLLAAEVAAPRVSSQHWAYLPPKKSPLPTVLRADWLRQPLDAFIAARHEEEGVSPAPEADRTTLIRRLTFDLTGLPPTPDEVDAFLADTSPDAYERLVDRLLASPQYGERMAVDWLDLARYADTHGYHSDSQREMWRWRDWVIDSLNAGMPYDQFTVEQIAGDLLPNATLEQRLATGFHRNHMLNDENGAIPEEYLAEYVAERASTTATVWLGQTLACARCHDHKHDPFTQREFFQLYAFFNNVPENGLGGRNGNSPPVLSVPTHAQMRQLQEIASRLSEIDKQLAEYQAGQAFATGYRNWEARLTTEVRNTSQPPADAVAHLPFDEGAGDSAKNVVDSEIVAKLYGNPAWVESKHGQALLCDGETYAELTSPIGSDRLRPFTLSAWVFPTTADQSPIVSRLDETQYRRGFEWGIEKGKVYFRLTHAAGENEIAVQSPASVASNRWQLLTVTYDGSGRAAGVQFYANGKPLATEALHDSLTQHIATDQLLHVGRGDTTTFFRGMLDDVRVYDRLLTAEEVSQLAGGDPLLEIVRLPPSQRTAEQQAVLRKHYVEHVDPRCGELLREQRKLQRSKAAIERAAPSVMVLAEMETPRPSFVHLAGRYDLPGERVTADVPQVLPSLPAGAPKNRLGLARWMVAPENPLVARVAVNRQWQTFFGAGLVRTPDDFGLLGERPTHPELLDWLACDFREHGWDVKRLHRQIVTSATYRQSGEATHDLLVRDPENRLLARATRNRLPAEMLRDAALHAAGQLQLTMGGPSVRPYQPAELWSELAYNAVDYSAQKFEQSHGADLYRRSVYTFWKRTVPPPNMALLDAPNRELCSTSRPTTESPLQALVLLNDATFVEAARLLAERAMLEPAADWNSRIDYIYRSVLSRRATDAEAAVLQPFYDRQQARYAADPKAADQLLGVGESPVRQGLNKAELAAWTNVATAILNLDEALTRN